ncbi:hypothetical protein HHI36_013414 [Cryptolaemus montrouzieri]|uniref:Uncharacterized protein n=1 Tax=Cryptolaemus montrouzieri TaxID=559131 RepID=A0ABD2NH73_9CUCU
MNKDFGDNKFVDVAALPDRAESIAARNENLALKNIKLTLNESSIIKYSDAVKKSSQETIVEKPKKDQQSSATKLEIQNKIDPSTLGIEVTKVKHTRNGGVAISCTNKEDVKNISENIKE